MPSPIITIYTDASFSPELKIGAWACHITGDRRAKSCGIIESCDNSTEAERIGVAGALDIANKTVNLKNCNVVLYCDNKAALKPVRLSTKTGQKKQRGRNQLKFYQSNIEPYLNKCLSYEIHHVKGHLRNSSNIWCDKKAKELLTEYKKSIALLG